MTIILTQAVRISGTTQPIGTQLTLEGGAEGDLVHRGCATYVTDPHLGQGDMTVRANINTVTGRIENTVGGVGYVATPQKCNPPAAPSGVAGVFQAGTLANGTYNYKCTFVLDDGTETNASAASANVVVSGGPKTAIVTVPVSSDQRVVKRRIYRTTPSNPTPSGHTAANASGTYWRASGATCEIADNTTTTWTDQTADQYYGTPAPDNNNTNRVKIPVGASAYTANWIGETTTAVGLRAGESLNSGFQCNTLFGALAGKALTNTGAAGGNYQGITAIGYQALSLATTPETCTAVGTNSLWQLTSAGQVTAVGVSSGNSHTTGNRCVYLGVHAGYYNVSGSFHTYIGPYAGDPGAGSVWGGATQSSADASNIVIGFASQVPAGLSHVGIIGSDHANGYVDNFYWGGGYYSATPVDVTHNAAGGNGTNVSGAKHRIAGGKGTGTGNGGSVVLSVAPKGSTGATQNALVDALELFSDGYVYIKNAGTVPAGTPSGGGYLYVEGGALKFKGSSGTVTTVAPA